MPDDRQHPPGAQDEPDGARNDGAPVDDALAEDAPVFPDVDGFGAAIGDPVLRRTAEHWARRIAAAAGDATTADDLVHHAYVRSRNWRACNPDAPVRSRPERWLTTTVRNLGLNVVTRARLAESLDAPDPSGGARPTPEPLRAHLDVDDVLRKVRVDVVRRLLVSRGDELWAQATAVLGATRVVTRHADQIRAAALQAAEELCTWGAMMLADSEELPDVVYHLAAGRRPAFARGVGTSLNTHRQLVRRNALPWISHLVWAAVDRSASPDEPDALLLAVTATELKLALQRLGYVRRNVNDLAVCDRLAEHVAHLRRSLDGLR